MNRMLLTLFFMVQMLAIPLPVFAQATERPNVVLIVVDDLNDYTGFLGGHPQVKTPNLDALASEGVVFTNAHTNAPICAPSRASMLTGIYPHVSHNFWFDKWTENEVLSNVKTLPRFLSDNGYDTYATGKLMHHRVESEWTEYGVKNNFGPYPYNGKDKLVPHPQMPDEYTKDKNDGLFISLAEVPDVPADDDSPGYEGWWQAIGWKPFKYVDDEDRDLLNDEQHAEWAVEKLRLLEQQNSDKPFFLAVGFVRPHTPLVVPQKYFEMYPLETLQIPVIRKNDIEDTHYRSTFRWEQPWTVHFEELAASYDGDIDRGLRKYVQAYLACITFVDEQVLHALSESEFDDNTIVVLVSDHGYNLGEKDFLYKNNLWEESARIPMIIKAPGVKGHTIDHPVSLIDVYPTIADFGNTDSSNMKNEKGKPLSGFSLRPFLENPESLDWLGPDVALTVVRGDGRVSEPDKQSYSVRSERYRYILYYNGKEELYDHSQDPYEWQNLATDDSYSDVKKSLKLQMKQLLGS